MPSLGAPELIILAVMCLFGLATIGAVGLVVFLIVRANRRPPRR